MFCSVGSVRFWEVCSVESVWILGSVLLCGKCFGFWEVFWILGSVLLCGKCFWILGSVFGFWEVFLDSGKCFGFWEVFWILGSVLDSGKCFVPMGHHTNRSEISGSTQRKWNALF